MIRSHLHEPADLFRLPQVFLNSTKSIVPSSSAFHSSSRSFVTCSRRCRCSRAVLGNFQALPTGVPVQSQRTNSYPVVSLIYQAFTDSFEFRKMHSIWFCIARYEDALPILIGLLVRTLRIITTCPPKKKQEPCPPAISFAPATPYIVLQYCNNS